MTQAANLPKAGPRSGVALTASCIPTELVPRFWSKADQADLSGCWPWLSMVVNGYPIFRWQMNRKVHVLRAHRAAFALAVADVPAGLVVGHACDTPLCVNPHHLWLGTQAANVLDAVRKGRNSNAAKTHCKNGHLFDAENTYHRPGGGGRTCLTCHRLAVLRFREKP